MPSTFPFQSTPLMRGETRGESRYFLLYKISIHSPHARGDKRASLLKSLLQISIHSPHARGDASSRVVIVHQNYFNPLPSCEGRRWEILHNAHLQYFNPLPSCEGRLVSHMVLTRIFYFNPLPSCEGRPCALPSVSAEQVFQSTPLMRGETVLDLHRAGWSRISIHSPHARGDLTARLTCWQAGISIHSPHARGDIMEAAELEFLFPFQSTPLMRGETA